MRSKGSGTVVDSKYDSLVIKTNNETSFDSRWCELKIQGKNVPSRSNHIAAFFNHKLYIHGGYDADKGVLSDFYCLDAAQDCQAFQWKKIPYQVNGKPVRLKSHSAVVYKTNLILFGGQLHANQSSNEVYSFDFMEGTFERVKTSGRVPKVDSHSACIHENKMYVYGGYIPEKAECLRDIYALDLDKMSWEVIHQSKKEQGPQGRSDLDMVFQGNALWVFGGTNGHITLNDFWKFDLASSKWIQIQCKGTPQARRGHSMVTFQGHIFLFGGIQDITKQKNDIYVFQTTNNTWYKIHTSTNSVYDCSPTLKQQRKKSPNKHSDGIHLHRVSPEKSSQKGSDVMKKILNQNKQKKFMSKKKQLLKQFSQKPSQYSKNRSLSPTTQSMLKTLQSIGNQEASKKQLKQEIMYDESHRYIIGKKPCARDGQTVNVDNGRMYIFGGDRHLMAFNDLYAFDLEKGLKSIDLYRTT